MMMMMMIIQVLNSHNVISERKMIMNCGNKDLN